MKRFAKIWNRIWFAKHDPIPAALFRIALGLLLTFLFFALRENWERWFAIDGVMSLTEADLNAKRPISGFSVFAWTEGTVSVQFYWALGMLSAVAFTMGLFTRACTLVLYLLLTSMVHRNPFYTNGEDLVARMMLFWGFFAPLGARLSVDAWLRNKMGRPRIVECEAWAVRALQLNFLLIYWISLPYKMAQDSSWITGDALHWTVASDMWWTRGSMPWITLACGGILRKAMTYGTLLIEFLFPICVWIPRTRMVALASIVGLHLAIALMIPGVTLFTLSMVVGSVIFLPAETIRRFGDQIHARIISRLFPHYAKMSLPTVATAK